MKSKNLSSKWLPYIYIYENGRAIKVFNRDSGDYFTINRSFPNLVFFSNFIISLVFEKNCKWVGHLPTKKVSF